MDSSFGVNGDFVKSRSQCPITHRFLTESVGSLVGFEIGRVCGTRTRYSLLAKPRIDFALAAKNVLECFISDKKNTNGISASEEEWLRVNVAKSLKKSTICLYLLVRICT